MMIKPEVMLMVIAIGMYLYDSALLLYCNEGVLIPKGEKDWFVGFGSDEVRIMGKDLYVPNPFLPHRPLFRLTWKSEGNFAIEEEDWSRHRNTFWPLVPMVWGMLIALFAILPLGLFTGLGNRFILMAILLLYLNIIAALLWLWFYRSMLKLSGKMFAELLFESLICPPFALNIIRKASAVIPVKEDLVSAARRLQSNDDWSISRVGVIARLDKKIDWEEEGSERIAALREYRRKLSEDDMLCPQQKSS